MKKMKFLRIILVMTVAVISLASCDIADPDGKWTPYGLGSRSASTDNRWHL